VIGISDMLDHADRIYHCMQSSKSLTITSSSQKSRHRRDVFGRIGIRSLDGHTAQTAIFMVMVRCRMESLGKFRVMQKNLNLCSSV
jgi:hypothetical protein